MIIGKEEEHVTEFAGGENDLILNHVFADHE